MACQISKFYKKKSSEVHLGSIQGPSGVTLGSILGPFGFFLASELARNFSKFYMKNTFIEGGAWSSVRELKDVRAVRGQAAEAVEGDAAVEEQDEAVRRLRKEVLAVVRVQRPYVNLTTGTLMAGDLKDLSIDLFF